MRVKRFNAEVLLPDEPVVYVTAEDVTTLRQGALRTARRRMRLCAHATLEEPLHEMIVALASDSYVRPHRHLNKSESFHVIEGRADIYLFDESGAVTRVIELSDYRSGKPFYYRLPPMWYHTVRVLSPTFVFHETTNGPFSPGDAEFAAWAPAETDAAAVGDYLRELDRRAEKLRSA